jgi:hypothetical protein
MPRYKARYEHDCSSTPMHRSRSWFPLPMIRVVAQNFFDPSRHRQSAASQCLEPSRGARSPDYRVVLASAYFSAPIFFLRIPLCPSSQQRSSSTREGARVPKFLDSSVRRERGVGERRQFFGFQVVFFVSERNFRLTCRLRPFIALKRKSQRSGRRAEKAHRDSLRAKSALTRLKSLISRKGDRAT